MGICTQDATRITLAGLILQIALLTLSPQALADAPFPVIGTAAPDFTLTNQSGRQIRLSQLRGKLVLLNFIYTHCVDVCPLTTASLTRVQNALIERGWWGTEIVFVSVTTDPARDTPAVLAQYAKRYRADAEHWHFVTGPSAVISRVYKDYGIQIRQAGTGLQEHHLPTFVIDRRGVVLGAYGINPNPDDVLNDLGLLRASTGNR